MDQDSFAVSAEFSPQPVKSGGGGRRALKIILLLIVIGLVATFIVQNFDHVEVRMFAWEIDVRLSLALLIFGIIGFLLGALVVRFLR